MFKKFKVIIVTAGYYAEPRPCSYAIAYTGGVPIVLLTGQTDVHLGSEVDGILLGGGAFVRPQRYRHDFDPTIERGIDETRDHRESSILQLVLERGLPISGICRGLQVINMFFGGTMHRNLAGDVDSCPPSKKGSGLTCFFIF